MILVENKNVYHGKIYDVCHNACDYVFAQENSNNENMKTSIAFLLCG